MGDIALRGNRLTAAKGGRAGYALGSGIKRAIKKATGPQGVFKPKGVKGKGSAELKANLKGLAKTFKKIAAKRKA